jgi:hypothetical protein
LTTAKSTKILIVVLLTIIIVIRKVVSRISLNAVLGVSDIVKLKMMNIIIQMSVVPLDSPGARLKKIA